MRFDALSDVLDGVGGDVPEILERKQIRRERGIQPPKTRCTKCGKVSRSDISGVSIRSALFALRNNGVITNEEFKKIDKSWMKHKKENGLDANGQRSSKH